MLDSFTELETDRFLLRKLKVDDVSERYAQWLSDQETNKYITIKLNLSDLRDYVNRYTFMEDVLFLGIFEKISGLHIGNIKYEPVNCKSRYAIMGILIGDPNWRGRGVAYEVISASARWLNKYCSIDEIILGVSLENISAIKAYQKIGFVECISEHIPSRTNSNISMVWRLI